MMKRFFIVLLTLAMASPCLAALVVTNTAVSNVTVNGATCYGYITSTNGTGSNVTATLYWGTSDATTNGSSWGSSNVMGGTATVGSLSFTLSNLAHATHYYVNWFIKEYTNEAYGKPSTNFTTLGNLVISNGYVVTITNTWATLYGTLYSTNGTGLWPTGYVYYGMWDCTTNKSAWEHSVTFGTMTNNYLHSKTISGLVGFAHYFYRWYVEEGSENAWAPVTSNFWTSTTVPTNVTTFTNYFVVVNTNGALLAPTAAVFAAANSLATKTNVDTLFAMTSIWSSASAVASTALQYCVTNGIGTQLQAVVETTNLWIPKPTNAWSVLYFDGNTQRHSLAVGAAGMYLKSYALGSAPTWDYPHAIATNVHTTNLLDVASNACFLVGDGQFFRYKKYTDVANAISATSLLAVLETVDGAGSQWDSDYLDGAHAAQFLQAPNPASIDTLTNWVAITSGVLTVYFRTNYYPLTINPSNYQRGFEVTNAITATTNLHELAITNFAYVNSNAFGTVKAAHWVIFHTETNQTGWMAADVNVSNALLVYADSVSNYAFGVSNYTYNVSNALIAWANGVSNYAVNVSNAFIAADIVMSNGLDARALAYATGASNAAQGGIVVVSNQVVGSTGGLIRADGTMAFAANQSFGNNQITALNKISYAISGAELDFNAASWSGLDFTFSSRVTATNFVGSASGLTNYPIILVKSNDFGLYNTHTGLVFMVQTNTTGGGGSGDAVLANYNVFANSNEFAGAVYATNVHYRFWQDTTNYVYDYVTLLNHVWVSVSNNVSSTTMIPLR